MLDRFLLDLGTIELDRSLTRVTAALYAVGGVGCLFNGSDGSNAPACLAVVLVCLTHLNTLRRAGDAPGDDSDPGVPDGGVPAPPGEGR